MDEIVRTLDIGHGKVTLLKNLLCPLGSVGQHDNVHPRSACLRVKEIDEIGCEALPHLLYSPYLAPSNFHLFGYAKGHI